MYTFQAESTPKVPGKVTEEPDVSNLIDNTLTPMKIITPTASELGSQAGSEAEFVMNTKSFSRNSRLHDKKAVEVSVRRSLRLTPSPNPSSSKVTDRKKN